MQKIVRFLSLSLSLLQFNVLVPFDDVVGNVVPDSMPNIYDQDPIKNISENSEKQDELNPITKKKKSKRNAFLASAAIAATLAGGVAVGAWKFGYIGGMSTNPYDSESNAFDPLDFDMNVSEWSTNLNSEQKYMHYVSEKRRRLRDVIKDDRGAIDDPDSYSNVFVPTSNKSGLFKDAVISEAVVYKIHLQVKQKYLLKFVDRLKNELCKNSYKYISRFKVTESFTPDRHNSKDGQGHAYPIIVLYVTEMKALLDREIRNKILNGLLGELLNFVEKFCLRLKITQQDLAWPVVPRSNMKITDVVYIAGGNGDYKEKAKDRVVFIPYNGNVMYSDDMCFVNGYEYTYESAVK